MFLGLTEQDDNQNEIAHEMLLYLDLKQGKQVFFDPSGYSQHVDGSNLMTTMWVHRFQHHHARKV